MHQQLLHPLQPVKYKLLIVMAAQKKAKIQTFTIVGKKLTASPTVPRPKTATIDPGSTFAVFQTAPSPRK